MLDVVPLSSNLMLFVVENVGLHFILLTNDCGGLFRNYARSQLCILYTLVKERNFDQKCTKFFNLKFEMNFNIDCDVIMTLTTIKAYLDNKPTSPWFV